MSEITAFFERTGVALGMLIWGMLMARGGAKAVWATLKPRIEKAFDLHFALVDSLINRNDQQIVHDEANMRHFATMLTKPDAIRLAEHHCRAIAALAANDSGAVTKHLDALQEELEEMKGVV